VTTKADDPIPALKRQLAQLVVERIRGWSQIYAAELLGTDQPRLSDLRRGRLDRFSLEQLIRFVSRVDGEVEITVEWQQRRAFLFATPRKE
jgi:predicted XRE-type DNA-binding protein